jgi:AsmA protein
MRRAIVLPLTLVVTILLLLIAAIHHFVRADNFRPEIEAEATAILGRKVQLGEIHLSLSSAKIVADDIRVADDPAFSSGNILTAQSLEISVKLWPLITSRQLLITGIELDQPEIRLLSDSEGKWNFDSLGTATGASPTTSHLNPQSLSVDQIRVTNGTIIT